VTSTAETRADPSARGDAGHGLGPVLDAVVGVVAAKLDSKTADWVDKLNAVASKSRPADAVVALADQGLDAVADSGGVLQRAGAEGVKARVHGKSPAWAAIRGAWQAGEPPTQALIVTSAVAAVVLLLVSPVLLLVYLLSWLVIAAVARARSARQHQVQTA